MYPPFCAATIRTPSYDIATPHNPDVPRDVIAVHVDPVFELMYTYDDVLLPPANMIAPFEETANSP
jgi:hypothetical protein